MVVLRRLPEVTAEPKIANFFLGAPRRRRCRQLRLSLMRSVSSLRLGLPKLSEVASRPSPRSTRHAPSPANRTKAVIAEVRGCVKAASCRSRNHPSLPGGKDLLEGLCRGGLEGLCRGFSLRGLARSYGPALVDLGRHVARHASLATSLGPLPTRLTTSAHVAPVDHADVVADLHRTLHSAARCGTRRVTSKAPRSRRQTA
jgi:hypothetical protein